MRRRDFMTIFAGAAAYPRLAGAQQKAMPVIGILAFASPDNSGAQRMLAAFRKGLGEAGYFEGQNVAIEYAGPRSATTDCQRWPLTWSGARST